MSFRGYAESFVPDYEVIANEGFRSALNALPHLHFGAWEHKLHYAKRRDGLALYHRRRFRVRASKSPDF